ncbi:uncharacterized protein LOC133714509 [Rosa rugosa]|uniref:uncharacterized protein LOC133714509 n=1 Tax=Rosa rugosa TaxID=74645 RepID=UPI002B40473A|nr:uncharacterized protein LOC133714509 [Rosa rugosa]
MPRQVDEYLLQNYSHKHPLILKTQYNHLLAVSCEACGDPVQGPYYSCIKCSNEFNLHKSCAQLPKEIPQHPLHREHPLTVVTERKLVEKTEKLKQVFQHSLHSKHPLRELYSSSQRGFVRFECHACRARINGFSYSCRPCEFDLHVKCAFNSRNTDNIQHFIHNHLLTLSIEKGPQLFCTRCLGKILGPRYICEIPYAREGSCSSIVLHQSCAKLDERIQHLMHKQHPLILILNDAQESHCDACDKDCSRRFTYSCVHCHFNLHLKCIPEKGFKHFSHEHPLMFKELEKSAPSIICDGCQDLVLGPRYTCINTYKGHKCSFNLHKSCADLAHEMQHPMHQQHPLILNLNGARESHCVICDKDCSRRFTYNCVQCDFNLDLKCIPEKGFKHFSHEHPLLFKELEESASLVICDGCQDPVLGPRYTCINTYQGCKCCFNLHKSCANLPREMQHPMHQQHPLILNLNEARESHCDVCDKDCSRRFTYSCVQCDFHLDLKCFPKKGFKHFSHEHPQVFKELEESDPSVICDGCQDPILGSRYTCINTYQGCKCCFNLHKSCADLPREMQHSMHQQHPLILNLNGARESHCDVCDKDLSRRFTYSCVQCDFNLHPKCFPEKGFKHLSHEHPLVFKEFEESALLVICDGCQDPVLGPRYTCINTYQGRKCCFNLHKSCADLAHELQHSMHHQHPLILNLNRARESYCDICDKDCRPRFTYSCVQCDFNLDLKYIPERGFKHFSHEHPLVFKELEDSAPSVICDGCQDPVLGSRYSCINTYQGCKCCFNLHKSCADLPCEMQHPMHQQHPLILNLNGAQESYCDVCDKDCSRRFTYSCVQCNFNLDLKCIPEKGCKHFIHQHPLVFKELEDSAPSVICDGCQDPVLGPRYTCINTYQGCKCCFNLHKSCADLPSKMHHMMHQQHPLILNLNGAQESYCDVCDKDCNRRFTYSCVQCDFNLDLKCIPEKGFEHFSHGHPLVFKELVESAPSVIYDGCQDPVLGPRYTCINTYQGRKCCFNLHKSCADLPREMQHPMHQQHPLILNLNGARESHCDVCDKDCSHRFIYSCVQCDFNLDFKCFPKKGFKHLSHEHPLVFKELEESALSVICDGCQDPVLGPRYTCINTYQGCKCCFNLHKSCADLPREMQHPMHPQHPLILNLTGAGESYCDVCDKDCIRRFTYSCVQCDFNLDLKCIPEKCFKHFSHEHPLVFKELEESPLSVICDGCQDPVLGPRYTCINTYQGHKCCFNLHKSCADLAREMQHPMHQQHPLILNINGARESHCDVCDKDCSRRFTYSCVSCDFNLDLKCIPEKGFKHFSHEHPLMVKELEESASSVICDGCQDRVLGPRYTCINTYRGRKCCFNLHESCADLPCEMQHPMHRLHPLILNLNGARESRCDACDKDCSRRFTYSCFHCDFNLDLKCASEKGFLHFSHEHPLMIKKQGDRNRECGPLVLCDGCQDPVFDPSYTCINTYRRRKCRFNLHKSCAELPGEIQHPAHRQHPLFLLNKIQDIKVRCSCNACNQPCRYRYSCSKCDFNFHLKCATNWRNIIETESHEHQLMVPRNQLHVICDVCGEFRSGTTYYVCSICQLLVDEECASLPCGTKIPGHQHRLKLTWFLEDIYPKDQVCKICSANIDRCRAVYYCQECCGYVAHTTCMPVEYFQKEDNKDRDVNIEDDDYESDDAEKIKHFSHQHLLVANDHCQEVKDDRIITCQGCIRPVTQDFYSCNKQEESCHFYLHKTCARLPEKMLLPFLHQHQFILHSRATSFDGVFQCYVCGIHHQGFVYSCDKCALPTGENLFYLDLECSIYWENKYLKHESHAHRLLLDIGWEDFYCRGCGSKIFFCFSCKRCNFHLCLACVRLPLTAEHRYDTHPLKLTYESIEDELGEYYCEICEGKRDPSHWFYWCKECEFDCHPHCIKGRYPRVQLGSTYKHDAHVQHPVTLVSKWKSPIQGDKRDNILPCEKCGELCQGLVFECGECNINFHRDGCCGTIASESSHRYPQIEELS